jgi:regulatory protein
MAKGRLSPRDYLIYLLGRREYSEKELRARLKTRACTPEETEDAMTFIKENGIQSDDRYAAAKARMEGRRKGNRGVHYALASKGIRPEQIAQQLADLPSEEVRVREAVRRFDGKALDMKLKGRVWRFLASRGFSPNAIKAGIAHLTALDTGAGRSPET